MALEIGGIPKKTYGTSSAQYGQVSQEGKVEYTPQQIQQKYYPQTRQIDISNVQPRKISMAQVRTETISRQPENIRLDTLGGQVTPIERERTDYSKLKAEQDFFTETQPKNVVSRTVERYKRGFLYGSGDELRQEDIEKKKAFETATGMFQDVLKVEEPVKELTPKEQEAFSMLSPLDYSIYGVGGATKVSMPTESEVNKLSLGFSEYKESTKGQLEEAGKGWEKVGKRLAVSNRRVDDKLKDYQLTLESIDTSDTQKEQNKDLKSYQELSDKYKQFWDQPNLTMVPVSAYGTSSVEYGLVTEQGDRVIETPVGVFTDKGELLQLGEEMPKEDADKFIALSSSISERYKELKPQYEKLQEKRKDIDKEMSKYNEQIERYQNIAPQLQRKIRSIESRDPIKEWGYTFQERADLFKKKYAGEDNILTIKEALPGTGELITNRLLTTAYGIGKTGRNVGYYLGKTALDLPEYGPIAPISSIYDPLQEKGYRFDPNALEGGIATALYVYPAVSSAKGVASGFTPMKETVKQSIFTPANMFRAGIWAFPEVSEGIKYAVQSPEERNIYASQGRAGQMYGSLIAYEGLAGAGKYTGRKIGEKIVDKNINEDIRNAFKKGNYQAVDIGSAEGYELKQPLYGGEKTAIQKRNILANVPTRYGNLQIELKGAQVRTTKEGLLVGKSAFPNVKYRFIDAVGKPYTKWIEGGRLDLAEKGVYSKMPGEYSLKGEARASDIRTGISKEPIPVQADISRTTGESFVKVPVGKGKYKYYLLTSKERVGSAFRKLTVDEVKSEFPGISNTKARDVLMARTTAEIDVKIPISKKQYLAGLKNVRTTEWSSNYLSGGGGSKAEFAERYMVEVKQPVKSYGTQTISKVQEVKPGATQSLWYAGDQPPSQTLKAEGRVYGFSDKRFAEAWAKKMGYKNIYQFQTNSYKLDPKTYVRKTPAGTELSDNEFISYDVVKESKVGAPETNLGDKFIGYSSTQPTYQNYPFIEYTGSGKVSSLTVKGGKVVPVYGGKVPQYQTIPKGFSTQNVQASIKVLKDGSVRYSIPKQNLDDFTRKMLLKDIGKKAQLNVGGSKASYSIMETGDDIVYNIEPSKIPKSQIQLGIERNVMKNLEQGSRQVSLAAQSPTLAAIEARPPVGVFLGDVGVNTVLVPPSTVTELGNEYLDKQEFDTISQYSKVGDLVRVPELITETQITKQQNVIRSGQGLKTVQQLEPMTEIMTVPNVSETVIQQPRQVTEVSSVQEVTPIKSVPAVTEPMIIPGVVTPLVPTTIVPNLSTPWWWPQGELGRKRNPLGSRLKGFVNPLADYRIIYKRMWGYAGSKKIGKFNMFGNKYADASLSDVGNVEKKIKELIK